MTDHPLVPAFLDGHLPDGRLTRRRFLVRSALASSAFATSVTALGRFADAETPARVRVPIPRGPETARRPVGDWFPEIPFAEELRAMALLAMDAARQAHADFADIRIGVQRSIVLVEQLPSISYAVNYGIRACVDGTWGYQFGDALAPDMIAATARGAVAGSRQYANINRQLAQRQPLPWVDAPAVTGEWRMPSVIDPFAVPLDDYARVLASITDVAIPIRQSVALAGTSLGWTTETRVFASTHGSLVTQERVFGGPVYGGAVAFLNGPQDAVMIDAPGASTGPGGFERALEPHLLDRVRVGVDEAIRLRSLPKVSFTDIGRFPIVFDGYAASRILGQSVSFALDADRATGIEADAGGDTYLAPMLDVLGRAEPTFSPLLTIRSDRELPSSLAVRWDDDGIVSEPFTLVDRGHVVDYHTTRETAPYLAEWYAKRGHPVRSRGTCLALTPNALPAGGAGHVQVQPAATSASVYDLVRDVSHGFLVRGGFGITDPGLLSGTYGAITCVEIRRGIPVARTELNLQYVTKTLFKKNLIALGDASSVRTSMVDESKGFPWRLLRQEISAPAMVCKDVDVVQPLVAS